jgi:hypothetical protein
MMANHFLAKACTLIRIEYRVVLSDSNIRLEAKNGRTVPSPLYCLHGVVLMQRGIFDYIIKINTFYLKKKTCE